MFHRKSAIFQANFMRDDAGTSLQRAVRQACAGARGTLLWEVPKGRRFNARETDLACALRELQEETGIAKSEYSIVPGVKRRSSFVSYGTRYVAVYFVAIAGPRLSAADGQVTSAITDINQLGEVSEIGWHDIESIRYLEKTGRLETLIGPAFRLVKRHLKGGWAPRRRPPGRR